MNTFDSDIYINPEYILPTAIGESIHIGYVPVPEEVAFSRQCTQLPFALQPNIYVSRQSLSLEQLISCIRKMVHFRDNMTSRYIDSSMESYTPFRQLFKISCVRYERCQNDELGWDTYVTKFEIFIHAHPKRDSYLVEVNRLSGDRNVFYRFYKTLRHYLEYGGTVSPSILLHCGVLDPLAL